MKKILMLFILPLTVNFSQPDFSVGMGISFVTAPDLRDYINYNFGQGNQLSTFNSVVEFFAETDYPLNGNLEMGIEYAVNIFSYNTPIFGTGIYEISYNQHMPSALIYYVVKGKGYKVKIGGGAGFRYVSLKEKIIESVSYSTSGFGLLLRAQGLTLLSGNLFAYIGGDIRLDFPAEIVREQTDNIKLNSLAFGVKLGVSYLF